MINSDGSCNIFWGSHGCDESAGHDGQHRCKLCCGQTAEPYLEEHLHQHNAASADQYGMNGCAGTWPYYGRTSMSGPDAPLPFFSRVNGKFQNLSDEFNRMEQLHHVQRIEN
jgi:hypothetical protein